MAAQKTKIWLLSTVTLENGKKAVYRYATKKSSGKSKGTNTRLKLRKYNPLTKKHETFEETKFKS